MTDFGLGEPGQRFVIQRKLAMPDIKPDIVPRERLTERIRRLLEQNGVCTVTGAPGSGKSTAVAIAVSELGRPIAWLSLDGSESPPGRLVAYLESAVGVEGTAQGVATEAIRSGISEPEAAGLLAESWAGSDLVLVCDNVESIAADETSAAILSSLVRYLPDGISLVLISRDRISFLADAGPRSARSRGVVQTELDFDRSEAEEALRRDGDFHGDLDSVLARSGGWVTGTLLEGRRTMRPDEGWADELDDYLRARVLGQLPELERKFLLRTSFLSTVTVDSASAVGEPDAARIMARLRTTGLPARWTEDHEGLILHPQFREFLRTEVSQVEDGETVRRLRRVHADVLAEQGRLEESVDALLQLGETEDAWRRAALALPGLVAKMDFASAARWLDQMDAVNRKPTSEVGTIVLRVSFALEQCGRGIALLERHGLDWLPGPESPHYEEALLLAAWCRWHEGRLQEAHTLAERLPAGRAREAAENLLALSEGSPPPFPEFSPSQSDTIDGLLMRVGYWRGRIRELDRPAGATTAALGVPWVVAGLRATGRLEEAMEIYEVLQESWQPPWLHAFDAVDLMIDLGRREEAWAAMARGRRLIAETGSRVYAVVGHLNEAKLSLRLHRDPEAAFRAIAAAEAEGADGHAFSRELCQLWRGLALLIQDRDDEARGELAASVDSMLRGDRRLELATAAVYLAEAHWRLGEEEASDASAELALAEASARGSQHLLLTALSDVPAVAVRAADASPSRLSRWHELTVMLSNQESLRVSARAPRLMLEEFGDPIVTLDGQPVTIRLSKSIELLSYLLAARRDVHRQELLGALFGGSNDGAGRSYLRQALYRLREALPEEVQPQQDGDRFYFQSRDLLCGTSQVVLDSLVQADRQDDEIRLRTMIEAFAHASRGPYLATLSSPWVEDRRPEIAERITTGRIEAARLAFRLSRYREARQLVEEVLRLSPHREQAWQLAISVAHASGSDDAVLALYQQYVIAMRDLGVPPSAEVRRLVTQLRR